MTLTSRLTAMVGIIGALSIVGTAGESKVAGASIKVSMAVVEIQLTDKVQFGMDAIRIADPACLGSAGTGLSMSSIPELLEELLKMDGSRLGLNGFSYAAINGEAGLGAGSYTTRMRIPQFEELERLSVRPMIESDGNISLSVTHSTQRVTGYKRKRLYKRKALFRREPVVSKQALDTRITVSPGKTAIIGGLIRNDGKHRYESLVLVRAELL